MRSLKLGSLVGALVMLTGRFPIGAAVCATPPVREAVSGPGLIASPGHRRSVTLTVASMGGYDVLSFGEPPRQIQIEDVTAVVWISDDEVALSVSPIYGKPGIYVLDCLHNKVRRILAPKTYNSVTPDGADYFELKELIGGHLLRFYYAPDVDTMDAANLRTPAHLFSVRTDGSQFRKVR